MIFIRTSSAKDIQQEDVWGSLQEFETESQKSSAAASETLVAIFKMYSKLILAMKIFFKIYSHVECNFKLS